MNKYTILSVKYAFHRRPMHCSEMLETLGVTSGRLPLEGMTPRMVQGVNVWVLPFMPKFRKGYDGNPVRVKSSTHRVMCSCPGCGTAMSVGRLHQHKCVEPVSQTWLRQHRPDHREVTVS